MTQLRKRMALSKRKRLFFSLLALAGFGCLSVLGGEVVFRMRSVALTARIKAALGDSNTEEGWAIFDNDLHYRNRPDWRDHNSHGMRDAPLIDKDRFRILLLGDSIGYYGDPISETYPTQLEVLLNRDSTFAPSEIINTSTKGYTNYQELVYLKTHGLAFEPDAVGVAFCVNDLHKYLHQFDIVNGEIVANTYTPPPEAFGTSTPAVIDPICFLPGCGTRDVRRPRGSD